MVERLICIQEVMGSMPIASNEVRLTSFKNNKKITNQFCMDAFLAQWQSARFVFRKSGRSRVRSPQKARMGYSQQLCPSGQGDGLEITGIRWVLPAQVQILPIAFSGN
eukprot:TRINITY_DN764_c0_g1_i3.p3 TRINITY_DN764_c0_g1~~TRINITY_DN764_c0_g1_i3.p3  ORF type:complete len:108 (+),score=6.16 TRINITY_DN764_c0_g1_i3:425-748(+)